MGKGIGNRLYAELFERLKGEDIHRFVAGYALPNAATEALHRRFGFTVVGVFNENGRKFGKYWDVCWVERMA
jgi:phosphinothricin acetyltransferase